MNDQNEVLTTKEAAEYIKVTRQTILKLFKLGELPGKRVGRYHRFLKEELREYIRSGKNTITK